MAMSNKMPEQTPGELEMLLPFHVAGTLNARDSRRIDEALDRDPELARQYAAIRQEYAETIHLNETLGAPSVRAMQKLFAAIDTEPPLKKPAFPAFASRAKAFFASLSPRALVWSASVGAVVLLAQAAVIGAVLLKNQPATYETASLSTSAPITRDLGGAAVPRALVRFAPDARAAEITALLDNYQASVLDGPKAGLFQVQFGTRAMTKDEVAGLMKRLQSEKIVSLVVAAP
jgi:hypothetical protein